PACVFVDDKKPVQAQSIDDLTQEEVDKLMLRETVDDILKEEYSSGRIQRITYDSSTGKTNFRELVYQDNIPKEHKKPVLMLVADGDGQGWFEKEKYVVGKGDAIVVKKLAQKYTNFRIIFYDPSIDPEFKETREGEGKFGAEIKKEGALNAPSIFLYGLFDLTKEETEQQNDRNIKGLDIYRGGPVPKDIIKTYRNSKKWVDSNLGGNSKYVWRTNNTQPIKWIKIVYNNS
ncbi:hypothetical protein J4211_01780, partial [Candidatus Woesearchaeota archaeon]|nr:hypothetical protein [Candidatus Woesearchaeota archaeon]